MDIIFIYLFTKELPKGGSFVFIIIMIIDSLNNQLMFNRIRPIRITVVVKFLVI